jgi:hypothetical protein
MTEFFSHSSFSACSKIVVAWQVTGTSEASFEGKSTKTLSSGDNLQAFKIS